jgi:hypothetical protein
MIGFYRRLALSAIFLLGSAQAADKTVYKQLGNLKDAYRKEAWETAKAIHDQSFFDYNSCLYGIGVPLSFTLEHGLWDSALRLLDEKKVTVQYGEPLYGNTPLHSLVEGLHTRFFYRKEEEIITQQHLTIMEKILEGGCDVNGMDIQEKTPLANYIKHSHNPAVVKLLVQHGAQLITRTDSQSCNVFNMYYLLGTPDSAYKSIEVVLYETIKQRYHSYNALNIPVLLCFKRLKDTKQCDMPRPLVSIIRELACGKSPADEIAQALDDRVFYKEGDDQRAVTLFEYFSDLPDYKEHNKLLSLVDPATWGRAQQDYKSGQKDENNLITQILKKQDSDILDLSTRHFLKKI